jgi:hypothetical protein
VSQRAGPPIEYEVEERPILAIVFALVLAMAVAAVGFVPVFVGLASERREPGGGYIVLGVLTGLGHIVVGLMLLLEVLFTVGTGRGRTIGRLARHIARVHFLPGLDFLLGALGVGFATVYLLAFSQTIADLPSLPRYALGYTLDGWLGVWLVWASVVAGCFFWALWIDATLGREAVARARVELPEDEEYEEEY